MVLKIKGQRLQALCRSFECPLSCGSKILWNLVLERHSNTHIFGTGKGFSIFSTGTALQIHIPWGSTDWATVEYVTKILELSGIHNKMSIGLLLCIEFGWVSLAWEKFLSHVNIYIHIFPRPCASLKNGLRNYKFALKEGKTLGSRSASGSLPLERRRWCLLHHGQHTCFLISAFSCPAQTCWSLHGFELLPSHETSAWRCWLGHVSFFVHCSRTVWP